MPHQPKAKKPYRAPSFKRLDANTAKVALETKAASGTRVPGPASSDRGHGDKS
jgi:hypothetical protein